MTAAGGSTSPTKLDAGTALAPRDALNTAKSGTSRLARTDASLLKLRSSRPVNVMVKLDYDPIATYRGGVKGLRATSPKVTGRTLKTNRAAVRAYARHISRIEHAALRAIRAKIGNARLSGSYAIAYGGLALRLPGNEVAKLLSIPGVTAVQRDTLAQPLTDASPAWVGATAVWPSLGGSNRAGEGVKVGVIDTGIWPEHPSYNDPGISHPGGTYGCQFGNGTDPLLGAAFTCNDKLIGAYAKTNTYMAVIGALPGENCNNATDQCSARDSDGHGTHTSSTAAGSPVPAATLFGVNRGSISGMAPGAHVIMYRVCLNAGCFGSDSVSAVQQAILDDVDVLNFSISGGANAYTDAVELAFLDAYAAGILVNASAGNAGPGAGTANHAGPWTNTVAASTSNRHFVGALTLTGTNAGGGTDTFTMSGATITAGISSPTPVVWAKEVAGQPNDLCRPTLETAAGANFAPGSVAGKIVVCRRELGARVLKSYNVNQGGGAGMILYNAPPNFGLNTDNHWVPSIHLENTTTGAHPLVAFLENHTGETATFTSGVPTTVPGDVMTAFSSRGPVGDFVKPDVTAPGIQILAGTSPDPHDSNFVVGPPGQLFQAIAGTSMSSPHAAGVAALVKDAHPSWTPGQIKSAMMTSSLQSVMKQDGVTPSNPFDRGAGAIRANRAVNPSVTFDVPAADYYASATNPLGRIHLNLPSINAHTMGGSVTTTRTLKNVSGDELEIRAVTQAPPGATITVRPRSFDVDPGRTKRLTITISAPKVASGQYFGQITLLASREDDDDDGGGSASATPAVLPVAFFKRQGDVSLVHTCAPTTFLRGAHADCTVNAQNKAEVPSTTTVEVELDKGLDLRNVAGPAGTRQRGNRFSWTGNLSAAVPPTVNSITAGGPAYAALGGAPVAGVGDETIVNFNVPAFKYGSETYTRVAMSSNGYAVVGGGTAQDNLFEPQTFPNAARPNNVIAPFWSDLNPATGPAGSGLRAAIATLAGVQYIVLEWRQAPSFSNPALLNTFEVWLRIGATEGVHMAFGSMAGSADPSNAGAENRSGTSGVNLTPVPAASGSSFTVNTGPPTPGGAVTFTYDAVGKKRGVFDSVATLTSSIVVGKTIEVQTLTVN